MGGKATGLGPGSARSDDVVLRPARPQDETFQFELFRELHAGMFAGLEPSLVAMVLRQQFVGRSVSYRARYPDADDLVIEMAGRPVGLFVVDRAPGEWTLVDVALLPRERGRGLGTRVMSNLLAEAAEAGVAVRLVVRVENPARSLYGRLGFVETGRSEMDVAMERPAGRRPASQSSIV